MADEAKSARAQRAAKTSADARAAKPAYVPSAAKVRAGETSRAKQVQQQAAAKKLDGRNTDGDRPWNTHEYDFKKIGAMLTVIFAAIAAGQEVMWPEQDDYLGRAPIHKISCQVGILSPCDRVSATDRPTTR